MNYRVYCLVATKLQELLSHLSLQHLLGIEFWTFLVEMTPDKVWIVAEEALKTIVAAPNSIVRIEYFVVRSEISLSTRPLLYLSLVAYNCKVLTKHLLT